MSKLAQARKNLPEFDALSDAEFVDVLREVYYPDMDREALASSLGVKLPKAKLPARTWGQALEDTGRGVMSGFAGLVKTGGDLYGLATGDMENAASEMGSNAQAYWEAGQSDQLKEKKAERKAEIDAAEGMLGKAGAAIKATLTDPALAADAVSSNLPTMVPGAIVGRAGSAAKYASGMRAAQAVGPVSPAQMAALGTNAAKWGTGAAVGVGAVQQGGDVSGDVYRDSVKAPREQVAEHEEFAGRQAAYVAQGYDEVSAGNMAQKDMALNAARATFLPATGISVLANTLPGGTMLERALVGGAARDTLKAGSMPMLRGVAKGALGEGAQEALEEGGGAFSGNVAQREFVNPAQQLDEGVGEAAGMGAAGGMLMGGAAGAFHREAPELQQTPPPAPVVPPAPPAGPLTRAAAIAAGGIPKPAAPTEQGGPPPNGPMVDPETGEVLDDRSTDKYEQAKALVQQMGTGSTELLERHLQVTPAEADALMRRLESEFVFAEMGAGGQQPAEGAAPAKGKKGKKGKPEPVAEAPPASFPTYEDAEAYVSSVRRGAGRLPYKALPAPNEDGTFSLVPEGDARWAEAQKLRGERRVAQAKAAEAALPPRVDDGTSPLDAAGLRKLAKTHDAKAGDVLIEADGDPTGYVPLERARQAVQALAGEFNPAEPFALRDKLGISPNHWDRVSEGLLGAAPADKAPAAAAKKGANQPAPAAANEYPTKAEAMKAGEAAGGNYTVEPVGERDASKPWRLVLDVPAKAPAKRVESVNGQTFELTPEQAAAWDEADKGAEKERMAARKKRAAGEKHGKTDNPDFGLRSPREEEAAELKAIGMRLSAQRRRIVGAETPKEKAAQAEKDGRVRTGDAVTFDHDGKQGSGTVKGAAYGMVNITQADGTNARVPRSSVTKVQQAQAGATLAEGAGDSRPTPAPAEPADALQVLRERLAKATPGTPLHRDIKNDISALEKERAKKPAQAPAPESALPDARAMDEDTEAVADEAFDLLEKATKAQRERAAAALGLTIEKAGRGSDTAYVPVMHHIDKEPARVRDVLQKVLDEQPADPQANANQREGWEKAQAERLGLKAGGAGWTLNVGNLGEVVVDFVSKPGQPLRAEVRAEYMGKTMDTKTAEGDAAIKQAIEDARDGIQKGRERLAERANGAPEALAPAADNTLPKWLATELDKYKGRATADFDGDTLRLFWRGESIGNYSRKSIEAGDIQTKMSVQKPLLDREFAHQGLNPDLTWRPKGGDTSVQDAQAKREKAKDDRYRARDTLVQAAKKAEAAGATETAQKLRSMSQDVGSGIGLTVAQRAASKVDADIKRELDGKAKAAPATDTLLDDELRDALLHLGDVMSDLAGGKMSIVEGKRHTAGDLLPALSKVVELLVRKGLRSFAQSVGKAAELMRANPATADKVGNITARQWKAAYNAIAEGHEGTDTEESVSAMDTRQVLAIVARGADAKVVEERKAEPEAEALPKGDVVIPASEEAFADALGDFDPLPDGVDEQVRGERERDEAMFGGSEAPVSLPRITSATPKPEGIEFLTPERAKAKLDKWKAEADRQGRELLSKNAQRTVISLFDASGVISQPWVDAGYNVVSYDLQTGDDINEFDAHTLLERHGNDEVYAILAQPPCTDFASSGAQWWKDKDEDGRTEASNELVRQTLRTIELFRPPVWVMENPVGRIAKLNKLPTPTLQFDPWHFGDTYTKRTLLWGKFHPNLPMAPVEPAEGSRMHKLSSSAKYERSLTPEGFAYALFMANNAEALSPAQRLADEFAGVELALFEGAVKSGKSEYDIRGEIEDSYYESDLETVREILEGMAPEPTPTKKDATPAERLQALSARTVRYASGLSRLGDFTNAAYVRANYKMGGVGVDVGEVSKPMLTRMAEAIYLGKAQVFVDSGAFSAFRKAIKAGAEVQPMDFDAILAKYDALLDEVGKLADREPYEDWDAAAEAGAQYESNSIGAQEDYPLPVLVMPDVVGDQAASLALVQRYKNWIGNQAKSRTARAIVPIQKGDLTMAEAYRKVVETLGTDEFIVGVPSNEAAVTPDELTEFLREAKPKAIHILGAASDLKLTPRLQSVVDAGVEDQTEVTADASPVRNAIVRGVAKGMSRPEAIEKALQDESDPYVQANAPKEGEPVRETAMERRKRLAAEKGADGRLERAKALMEEHRNTIGDKAATERIKRKARELAKQTPADEEKTVLALDMLATRLDMNDDPRKRGLEFAPAEKGAEAAPVYSDQMRAYANAIRDGKGSKGMLEQIKADERLNDGEDAMLFKLAADYKVDGAKEALNLAEAAKLPPLPSGREVGTRADGVRIYEDSNGVRFYQGEASLVYEKVQMRPTRQGMEVVRTERKPEFMTAQEAEGGPLLGERAPAANPATVAAATTKEDPNERALPDQSPQALDEVAAQEGGRPQGGGRVGGDAANRGEQLPGEGGRVDGEGVPAARSRGSRSTGVRSSGARARGKSGAMGEGRVGDAGRGVPQDGVADLFADAPGGVIPAPQVPALNFRITEDVRLGKGGEAEKFRDNLAAIETLKRIEKENRRATPDEQRVLARYVGWGGMPNAFPDPKSGEFKPEWKERGEQLRELLTQNEHRRASSSTTDAHYTSQTVVNAMWEAVQRMGYRGGLALELSVGTGNFIGLAPEGAAARTRFVAVEMDSITARIARALYPQETVLESPAQKVPLPDGAFDLSIGNPPFGSTSLTWQHKPEYRGLSIHNQFFLASMDALKPGGLMVKVVSRYLMDAQDAATRRQLAAKGKLLGAVRLPFTAFRENARTDVVTDIIVMQRYTTEEQADAEQMLALLAKPPKPGELAKMTPDERQRIARLESRATKELGWLTTSKVPDPLGGEPMVVNDYFAANPGMVVGTMDRSGSMKQNDINVSLPKDADFAAELAKRMNKLPAGVMDRADDAIQASLDRHKSMSDALEIAVAGLEPGQVDIAADGKLVQIIERETPEGDYEMGRRELTAASPWSPQLLVDAQGRFYRLMPKLDEQGNKVKVLKDGKPTKANEYTREVFETPEQVPETLRLGETRYERLRDVVGLRRLLKQQIVLESQDAPAAQMEANRKELAAAYKAYTEKHGLVSAPATAGMVNDMPDGALVLALESGYRPAVTAARAKTTGEAVGPARAKAAPILERRVVMPYTPPEKAESATDALQIVLAERGFIDVARVAELRGKTELEATSELTQGEKPLAYYDPESQRLEPRDTYLTGEVKRKLKAAIAAGLADNAKALQDVMPEPIGSDNVEVNLGAAWVPPEVYAGFLSHLTGGKARVSFQRLTNSYSVTVEDANDAKAAEWSSMGEDGRVKVRADELVADILNSKATRVTFMDADERIQTDKVATELAVAKRKEIVGEFGNWVFADAERRRLLVETFNEKFNTRVVRQYDGSHLTLPGKVPDEVIRLRRHQKNAIWRGISERFMLYDHVVGAGKTFTAIARAMERRRMGLSQKPMIVVPNHMVEQFASDAYRLYPGAKVLAAGKKDFERRARRRLFGRIATGDWDIVIVPHSSFEFIKLSAETEERFIEGELAQAVQAVKDAEAEAEEQGYEGWRKPFGVKMAEALVKRLEARMDALKSRRADNLLTFEQLGVDDLTVDEAHEYKNLFYSSRMTGIRGMGDRAGSSKAFDLHQKVRYLRETPTGAVTFMTGTPISNSVVEMYHMLRYLAADELADLGLDHFDAWRAQYVGVSTAYEQQMTGGIKEVNRLADEWTNMRSLMDLYYSVTDAVTLEDIEKAYAEENNGAKFPVPRVKGGKRSEVVVPPTKLQAEVLREVLERYEGLEDIEDIEERNAERLRLMDMARKVALDVRALSGRSIPSGEDNFKGGKLEKVASEVHRIYQQWDDDKGTQLIFLDRSIPRVKGDDLRVKAFDAVVAERDKALAESNEDAYRAAVEKLDQFDHNEIEELRNAGSWNAYDEIKRQLVARGIPAKEVRFIQEASTDAQKQAIFDAVKDGSVRVLIGSTPRMGAGTNVQDLLVALHHVDVGWKPSDIEQREGRIIRQGNLLLAKYGASFEVEVLAYVTERTADATMWALNGRKLSAINKIRKYDGSFRMEFADADSLNMAQIAALASGNPMMLERVQLMGEIDRLERAERAHRRRLSALQDSIDQATLFIERDGPRGIERYSAQVEEREAVAAAIEKAASGRSIEIEGKTYTDRMEANKAALEASRAQYAGLVDGDLDYGKFTLKMGGKTIRSDSGIDNALRAAFGDMTPFAATVDGKAVTTRSEAASSAAELVSATAINLANGASETITLGDVAGYQLDADVERTGLGYSLSLVLSKDGRTVAEAQSAQVQETHSFSTQGVRAVLDRLMDSSLDPQGARSNLDYTRRRMAQYRRDLPTLTEQLEEAGEFKQADELDQKRERLEVVIQELTTGPKAVNLQHMDDFGSLFDARPAMPAVDDFGSLSGDAKLSVEDATGFPSLFDEAELDAQTPTYTPGSPDDQANANRLAAAIAKRRAGFVLEAVGPAAGEAGREQRAVRDAVLRLFGKRAIFVRQPAGRVFNGAHLDTAKDAIFIDVEATKPLMAVAGHELLHSLRQDRPDLYDTLRNALAKLTRGQNEYARRLQSKRAVQGLDPLSDDVLTEEMVADIVGDEFTTPEFWQALGQENPMGLRRIAKAIVNFLAELIGKARPFGMAEFITDLEAARAAVVDAVRQYSHGEKGTQPDMGDFKLSIADDLRGGSGGTLTQALRERFADFTTSLPRFNLWHRTVGTQYHKAKINPYFKRVYDAAQRFLQDVSYFANTAADLAPGLLPRLDSLKDIGKRLALSEADQKAVANAVFTGTLNKELYDDKQLREKFDMNDSQIELYKQFRSAVDESLAQLTSAEVVRVLGDDAPEGVRALLSNGRYAQAEALVRRHMADEAKAAADDLKAQRRLRDNERARMRNAHEKATAGMDEKAKAAADEAHKKAVDALSFRWGGVIYRAEQQVQRWNTLLDRVEELYNKADTLKKQGYAPLMRFGRYSVHVTDDQGGTLHFGLYETQAEANAARRALAADFPEGEVTAGTMSEEAYKLLKGVSPETLAVLGVGVEGLDKSEAFEQYVKMATANHSALRRLIRRKNIAGFSEDPTRVLAAFLTSNARRAAGILHHGEMDKAVQAARDSKQGDVADEAWRLRDYVQNPVEEAAALKNLMFVNFIGGSVASALVNMTQPLTMTLPWLSQYGGPVKAAARLAAAIKDALLPVKDKALAAALAKAEAEGIVAPQEMHELQAAAMKGLSNNPNIRKGLFVWGSLFQLAEAMNRRVTFIAAWRTAQAEGMANPFGFSEVAVAETQGVYNKGNRPNWARGPIGGTVMTFKQYSISYMEFFKRLPSREKALALGIIILTAGIQGLPGADDLDDVIDTLGQKLGYNTNAKLWKQQVLEEAIGESAAGFVMRGATGLPGSPIDVAGRMSLGNLIPGTGLLREDRQNKANDLAEIAGPVAGLVKQVGALFSGDITGALPVALGNMAKSADMLNTGAFRDMRGRTVMETDGADAAAKFLGFQPGNVASEQRRASSVQQSISMATKMRDEISAAWAEALFTGDSRGVEKARQRMRDWNERNPDSPVRVSMPGILKRVRDMRATREQRLVKAAPTQMRASVREAMNPE